MTIISVLADYNQRESFLLHIHPADGRLRQKEARVHLFTPAARLPNARLCLNQEIFELRSCTCESYSLKSAFRISLTALSENKHCNQTETARLCSDESTQHLV